MTQERKLGVVVCRCCRKQQDYHASTVLCAFSKEKLHITSFISVEYTKPQRKGFGVPIHLLLGG